MVYTLIYKSEERLAESYKQLRSKINPNSDYISLYLSQNYSRHSNSDLYKLILKLEGKFRSESDTWNAPKINFKILNQ